MQFSDPRDIRFFAFRGLDSISGPLQLFLRKGESYRIRKVLGYSEIKQDVANCVSSVISYDNNEGFYGPGYEKLQHRNRNFLETWHNEYKSAANRSAEDAQEDAEYDALAAGFVYSGILGSAVALPLDRLANAQGNPVADGFTRFSVALGEFVSYAVPFIARRDKASASRAWEFIKDSGTGLFVGPAMQTAGYFTGMNEVDWYRGLTVSMYNNGNNWTALIGRLARDLKSKGLVNGLKSYFADVFQVANLMVMTGDGLWGGVIRPSMGFETESNTAALAESMALSSDSSRAAGLAMGIKRFQDRKLNKFVKRKFLASLYEGTA